MIHDFSSFTSTLNWIISHGYFLMFVIMVIEGPIVTAAAAFAAKLGYFNLWLVFLLAILGNLFPDVFYYLLGYWGKTNFINNFKILKDNFAHLEKIVKTHTAKTMLVIKLVPFIAVPGLVAAGAAKIKIKKFTFLSLALALPTSMFFLLMGYYLGYAYDVFNDKVKNTGLFLAAIAGVILFFYWIWSKVGRRIGAKLEIFK